MNLRRNRRGHRTLAALLGALLGGCATTGASARPGPELYQKMQQASVEILRRGRHAGSGWYASPDGLVVTAAHIVGADHSGTAILHADGSRAPATVVAYDLGHDLVLLRGPKSAKPVAFLKTAQRMPPPTSRIYVFGSALFRHQLLLPGTVARAEAAFEYLPQTEHYIECFHVTSAVQKGTSGAPWVNADGQVVGLQSGMMVSGNAAAGIAFVTPAQAIARLVATRRSARTPSLGLATDELWEHSVEHIARFPKGAAGVVPVRARKGSAAKAAGLSANTLITHVDGQAVPYRDLYHRRVRARRVGEQVTLTVLDADKPQSRRVRLPLMELEPAVPRPAAAP
ncbi:MAG: S1C family serine protease [Phycisphaerae bacterium]|nr:S1C family serine protease [Phycisphaerae bacterium]